MNKTTKQIIIFAIIALVFVVLYGSYLDRLSDQYDRFYTRITQVSAGEEDWEARYRKASTAEEKMLVKKELIEQTILAAILSARTQEKDKNN